MADPAARPRRAKTPEAQAVASEADIIFAALRPVVSAIQTTLGRKAEVLLHDYRRPEHSAIVVAGDVTGRRPGSAMSEIGLSLLRQGDDARDKLNYAIRLKDGRVVKSSTTLLRTTSGHVVGALCINIDVSELRILGRLLSEFAGDTEPAEPATTTFSTDIDVVIEATLSDIEASMARPLQGLSTQEWTTVFRAMDARGLFQLRRSAPIVAARLGLSRASVYNYLSRARSSESTADLDNTTNS